MARVTQGGALAAALCVAASGVTASAQASTAEYSANGMFSFTGSPGERNDVTFEQGTAGFRVRDAGNVITPGLGCVPLGLDAVECTLPPTGYQQCFLADCSATVDLGDGDDRAVVPFRLASSTSVLGGPGNDRLEGGKDTVNLDGGPGDDTLLGSEQGDSLIGGPGADLIDGRGGADLASYADRTAPVAVTLDGKPNDGEAGEGDDIRVGTVIGGAGDDTLVGGPGDDSLFGGGGADVLEGRGGNDRLFGGAFDAPDPADTLRCGDGDDVATLGDADVAALDCELAGSGLLQRIVVIDARTVRASKRGTVRLTVRRVKPPMGFGEFEQEVTGALRLTDGVGRAISSPASFALKPDATASLTVKLDARTRRRLARTKSRRISGFGVRQVSVALATEPVRTETTRIVGAVTVLAPRKRR